MLLWLAGRSNSIFPCGICYAGEERRTLREKLGRRTWSRLVSITAGCQLNNEDSIGRDRLPVHFLPAKEWEKFQFLGEDW